MTEAHYRELEEQIRALQQRLTEAQKLTALGELVGTTTHEFNNVLMTIMNYAKMGVRRKDPETRDRVLQKILTASERASQITNTILAMARNRSNSLEPTDLAQLINESLVLLEREMNKYRIFVEKQLDPVPRALANGNQIQQVLLNLLINARQAMAGGGQVTIRLSYDDQNQMEDLTVRDTGCGIVAEKLPRIFDRYYSTKSGPDESGKGGTGLGLSSCRDIIESHRGRIRVKSRVGQGTEFTIKLPVVPAGDRPSAAVDTHAAVGGASQTTRTG